MVWGEDEWSTIPVKRGGWQSLNSILIFFAKFAAHQSPMKGPRAEAPSTPYIVPRLVFAKLVRVRSALNEYPLLAEDCPEDVVATISELLK